MIEIKLSDQAQNSGKQINIDLKFGAPNQFQTKLDQIQAQSSLAHLHPYMNINSNLCQDLEYGLLCGQTYVGACEFFFNTHVHISFSAINNG